MNYINMKRREIMRVRLPHVKSKLGVLKIKISDVNGTKEGKSER